MKTPEEWAHTVLVDVFKTFGAHEKERAVAAEFRAAMVEALETVGSDLAAFSLTHPHLGIARVIERRIEEVHGE